MRPFFRTTRDNEKGSTMSATILLVDDDAEIANCWNFCSPARATPFCRPKAAETALELLERGVGADLIILDVMMPGLSGYKTCARIRETSNVPILFLTARGMDTDLTLGFSAGGDDYLSKPFSNAELLSRVKALLRRYHVYGGKEEKADTGCLCAHGLRVDRRFNEVFKDGRELSLTELEYRLLRLMMEHRGKIFSAENLYESVWGEPYFSVSANTVMVHIRKLRAKIEDDPQNPRIVKTVWGKGYRVE